MIRVALLDPSDRSLATFAAAGLFALILLAAVHSHALCAMLCLHGQPMIEDICFGG